MEGELTIRQLCDWAMFVKAHHAEMDWKAYRDWMDRFGMMSFANILRFITHHNLAIYVDFESAPSQEETLARRVLDDALYGKHETMSSENIIKYRIWQTKQLFKSSWKFRLFRGENVLVAYAKKLWVYWFDKVWKIKCNII